MDNPASSCACTNSCKETRPLTIKRHFITGAVTTSIGNVPQISTRLSLRDHLGTVRVRLGIKRDQYQVDPGLYAVGTPDERSDVFVTANYKLSFDTLRKHLSGVNAWLLVLDTKGINVWCAAGKGTFGTAELVNRLRLTSLGAIIKHRRLILPQLGAVGVAAHLVKRDTGFTVLYGPIRASDIPRFLQASYKATEEMRTVRFNFPDRAKLIPNDFLYSMRYLLGALGLFAVLSGINGDGFSFQQMLPRSGEITRNVALGYFSGIVLTPLLLPFIPVRTFALKGALMGMLLSALTLPGLFSLRPTATTIAWSLILTGISSFLAMNFTGSSTYTSLSGVKKEMRIAVPVQIVLVASATILMILDSINII